jgi:acetyltransferase-like isoleucine patch superfamily enzyme
MKPSLWQPRLRRLRDRVGLRWRSLWTDVTWGEGTEVAWGARLDTALRGCIRLGARCEIHAGAVLATYGGNIELADDCSVNPFSVLYGHGGLKIGRGVRIAAHCVLVPANHVFADPDEFIFRQGLTTQGIAIEDDVWLGAGVRVLDGVRIGRGCVIAAGAVVTAPTEPGGIYGGVPARRLKDRPGWPRPA